MKHRIFVYGTLLSNAMRPASKMVGATVLSRASMPGVDMYDLGWFPGLKVGTGMASVVQGEIIEVDDEGLDRLDAYEGAPQLYRRQSLYAVDEEGVPVLCQTYIYNGPVNPNDLIDSGSWIEYSKETENATA